jgi:hypothetical protein
MKNRGVKGEKSRSMSKYPKGPINQHKALATGSALRKPNSKPMGGGVDLKGGMGKGGKISSSGDTGGPRGGSPKASKLPNY